MEPVNDRIYAFDTIRTVMVLLGIVIHASMLYRVNIFNESSFFSDPNSQSSFFNVLGDFIHIFRMPVFFSISGFFTALIYFERGVGKLVSNRLHRLVYPLMAGIVVIVPMHVFSLNFFALSLAKLNHRYALAWSAVREINLADIQTAHLWFLYYLIFYCLTAVLLAYCAEKWFPALKKQGVDWFGRLFQQSAAPILFALPTFACLWNMNSFEVAAAHSLVPDWGFYAYYAVFFLFGWLCYGVRVQLSRFERQVAFFLLVAIALFGARWYCLELYGDVSTPTHLKEQLQIALEALLAFNTWFFTFGIIGFFLKFFNKPSRVSRYLSDGSYWIYLIHMPMVIYFQSLLLPYELPVFVKFSMVMLVTVLVAVLSYNYLVRNTFIGKFLNGRRYPRSF